MASDINALNNEMKEARVRIFVGGLHPAIEAKSLQIQNNGEVLIIDGPYLEANKHVGGFWILEVADLNAALIWGGKAAVACRAQVEARQFH